MQSTHQRDAGAVVIHEAHHHELESSQLDDNEEDSSEEPQTRTDAVDRIVLHLKSRLPVDAEPAHWLLESLPFSITINVAVCLNSVQMGMEADHPEWRMVWNVVEHFFTAFFLAEFLIKFAYLHWEYFKNHWNWLDFSLVSLSVLDTWILSTVDLGVDLQSLSILRILRLFRLVRILRLVKRCQKFVVVLSGLIDAMQATFWVSAVLVLILYVCAVFCVGQLGKNDTYAGWTTDISEIEDTDMFQEFNPHFFFGSMSKAMLTLFNIAILAEWQEIIRPIYLKQPVMVLFFVLFIMFVTFGLMNVIVGMIVDNVMQHGADVEKAQEQVQMDNKLAVLARTKKVWDTVDTDGDGLISLPDLKLSMQDGQSEMNSLLKEIELPRGLDATELFSMLNDDGQEYLKHEGFVECFYRLIDSGPFQHMCVVQKGINQIKANNKTTLDRLAHVEESIALILVAVGSESPLPHRGSRGARIYRAATSGSLGKGGASGLPEGNKAFSRASSFDLGVPMSQESRQSRLVAPEAPRWRSEEPLRCPRSPTAEADRVAAPLHTATQFAAVASGEVASTCAALNETLQAAALHVEREVHVAVNGELRHLLLASLRAMQVAADGTSDCTSLQENSPGGFSVAVLPELAEKPCQFRPPLFPVANDRVEASIGRKLCAAFDAEARHRGLVVHWGEQKMHL